MDFHARQYDPQIGRFLGIDPLADAYGQQIFSTYSAMGNAPTHMIDPNGESFYDNNTHIAAGKYSNSLPTDDEILSEMLMDQRREEGYNYGGGGGGGFGYLGSYRSTLDFVNGAGTGNSYIFTNYLTGIGLSYSIIGSQIRPNGTFYKIRIDGFSSSSENANWEEGVNVNWNYGKIYELFVPFSQKSAGLQQNGGTLLAGGISLEELENFKRNPPTHPDYKATKSGDRQQNHPRGKGWVDRKGRTWIPDNHDGTHAPHWDVQPKKGPGYETKYPFSMPNISTGDLIRGGVILIGVGIIIFDIVTIPSGEGLIGVQMIMGAAR